MRNYDKADDAILEWDGASELEIIEITSGVNGYPSNLRAGVIGFETMEEAEDFASKYDGSVVCFHRRDGWRLWNIEGWRSEMFDMWDGDDWNVNYYHTKQDLLNNLYDDLRETEAQLAQYEDDEEEELAEEELERLEDAKERIRFVENELPDTREGEIVAWYLDGDNHAFDVFPRYAMSFYEDTHHYCIGVEFDD